LVLIAGTEKADVLPLAVRGPKGAVPLRDLRPKAGITFICDRAAAAKL
jgi:6-phosphogluconolactonase/glucosamine-6-phosphate isomerase/deaminase